VELGPRVLVVDDHPLTREALAALLEQYDFAVVGQASDGAASCPTSCSSTSPCPGSTG